jgi:hemolysin activation/secretion protein
MRIAKTILTGSAWVIGGLILAQNAALAESAPFPYTASELPVMSATPNLILGTYGPMVKLDAPTIENIPEPIYLDKALESQGLDARIPVGQVKYQYESSLKKENKTVPQTAQLNLGEIKKLAQQELAWFQENGKLVDATIRLTADTLQITFTPLTVESVKVEMEDKRQESALRHLTRGLEVNEPLKLAVLKRQLRLIQANPDLSFKTELEVIPYTHQVKVNVLGGEPKKTTHLVASYNNLDQVIFGSEFGAVTGVANNLTGHGDTLMTGVVRGYRSTGYFTRYEYPIRPSLRATLEAQYASIAPHQPSIYRGWRIRGQAYKVSPGLKYTFLDKPNVRASADIQVDLKNAEASSQLGSLEREYVRTLRAGINYDQNIGKTYLSARHELAGAAAILGGSASTDRRLSWFKGGSQYWRYTGFTSLTRPLPFKSTGTVNLQWQYTPNGLSNFDVGGLGGTFYGRGYREVYIFVDRYAILTSQLQMPAYFIPKRVKLPFSSKTLRDSTQMLTFLDYGYGEIATRPTDVRSSYKVAGTGVGLRTQLTDRISGRLDIAYPIVRELPWTQKPRFHFGVDVLLR